MAQYPYWIEQKLDGTFSVWTKVSVPAGQTKKLYVIHQEGYSPDGDAVFDFFDDFDGDTLDTTKWRLASGATPQFQDSLLIWTGKARLEALKEFQDPASNWIAVESLWINTANQGYVKFGTYRPVKDCDSSEWHDARIYTGNGSWTCTYKDGSCGYHYTYSPSLQDGVLEVHYTPAGNANVTVNGQAGLQAVITRAIAQHESVAPYLQNDYGASQNNKVDWVRVRKLTNSKVVISYNQINDTTYEVTIENQGDSDLVDFQIELDADQIGGVSSKTQSLLIIDTLAKILFANTAGEVYTIQNDQLVKVADSIQDLTQEDIDQYGILGTANVSKNLLSQLGDQIKVLVYETVSQTPKVVVKIDPYPQVVATKEPITLPKGCDVSSVSISTSGDGTAKILVSPNGTEWYAPTDQGWNKIGEIQLEDIPNTPNFVWNNGVETTQIGQDLINSWLTDKGEQMYFAIAFDGDIEITALQMEVSCDEANQLDMEHEIRTYPSIVEVKFVKEGKFLVVVI